jgi:hypothetical protein
MNKPITITNSGITTKLSKLYVAVRRLIDLTTFPYNSTVISRSIMLTSDHTAAYMLLVFRSIRPIPEADRANLQRERIDIGQGIDPCVCCFITAVYIIDSILNIHKFIWVSHVVACGTFFPFSRGLHTSYCAVRMEWVTACLHLDVDAVGRSSIRRKHVDRRTRAPTAIVLQADSVEAAQDVEQRTCAGPRIPLFILQTQIVAAAAAAARLVGLYTRIRNESSRMFP